MLITSPAFWVKNTSFAASNLQTAVWDFTKQLLVYFSPQTYFGASTADINLQHFIPEIGPFYSWQIIPFFVGLFYLLKNHRTPSSRLILAMLFTSPLPGAMSGHFISIQRVLPIIVPIILIITLGVESIVIQLPKRFFKLAIAFLLFLLPISLLLLWRSYFILLPGLRPGWWNFGASEIASLIRQNSATRFVIDNSRDQALYSPIIFHLQYPPEDFQKQFTEVALNYYNNPPFNSLVTFGNATTRPINWETDPLIDSFLVGDTLSISSEQVSEHFLSLVVSVKDKTGKVHFNVYKTNPNLKIQDNANKSQRHYN